MANQPAHVIRMGRIRASIWKNATAKGYRYSVSVVCCYKDGDTWKDTTSFGRDDLPLVSKAADLAFAWIWNQSQPLDAKGDDYRVGT